MEARCVITTHMKPFHIYSIIPFKKRTSNSASKVKEKMEVRSSRIRQTSTTRPMSLSTTDPHQPFDPFSILGIERRTDGGQEVSYGYLLVPSKAGGAKVSVSNQEI